MNAKQLKIAEPCKVDWTKMTAADGGRFCGDCQKVVKNLSSMTEREAKKMLRTANEGQLCVRFLHDAHGNVFFGADAPRPDFVPASMLSRAKRALAVAGLAAASQACSAVTDVTNGLDPSGSTTTAQEKEKRPQVYESMGGVSSNLDYDYNPNPPGPDGGSDASSSTAQDGGAAESDAGAAQSQDDAGTEVDPN